MMEKKYNKHIGNLGEKYAAKYLKKKKYKILKCNYLIRGGEIDIIAEKDGYLIFVEVKTRSSDKYGTGAEAITYNKKQRMIKAAEVYLMSRGTCDARFDVIEVFAGVDGGRISFHGVNHIENAF